MNIPDFGALVISLDFELRWGWRDEIPRNGSYCRNFLGAREVIPVILEVFQEFNIAATWATVGLLFATSKKELENYIPAKKPFYHDPTLSPYQEPIGENEHDDPLHYAPVLIKQIVQMPHQEICSHTFSHYYCLEPGQNRDTFEADLKSALAIASKYGIHIQSIIFPRNQYNPKYDDILIRYGIKCYRGNQRAWMYQGVPRRAENLVRRGVRFLDSYLNLAGAHTVRWEETCNPNGICNIPASFFLRPYNPQITFLNRLLLHRIVQSIKKAAISKQILHIWWHPHNFGTYTNENIALLKVILQCFDLYRESHGLRSLSMKDITAIVTGKNTANIQ